MTMPLMTIEQAFGLAVQHHQAGRLREADEIYRRILTQQPEHAEALHLLGVVALQVGRNDMAVAMIRQAIALKPDLPGAYSNLGIALSGKGQLAEAVEAFSQAIALNPGDIQAQNNLGNALRGQGRVDEAIAACRQAIAIKPDYADAYNNLGNALRDKGQPDEAIEAFRQAIVLNPRYAEAHSNLGALLKNKGRLDEAIVAYRQAIALNPRLAETHYSLGNALKDTGQLDHAIVAYRQALALKPSYAEALNNLGNALYGRGNLDEAIAAYRQALALNPNMPGTYYNLGSALSGQGQLDEALAACRQAIVLAPNLADAHNNLGNALREMRQIDESVAAFQQAISLNPNYPTAYSNLGNALRDKGQIDDAVAAYRQAIALDPDYSDAHSNLIFALHYHPDCDAKSIAEEHRNWDRQQAEPLRRFVRPYSNGRQPERRLKIGYVSPDFRRHPVGQFLLPLLQHHDRHQVEVVAYAQVPAPDAMTQQLRAHTDHWHSLVGLSDEQAAELIRQHQIDILVDLTMHSANNRLLVFARKPAPVQVSYLAYVASTGMKTMDYRLSDPYLDRPGDDESFYSEETVRLPETYWCYQPVIALPEANSLPVAAHGHITFGCLNSFCKVNDSVLAVWAQILRMVPKSELLIHALQGSHRQRVHDLLAREGVEAQRVRFAGTLPLAEYFQLYHEIDIALDTFPFGGGTTTCDTLWMGVPVVSLVGKTAVGRGGLSILSNIGLPELVGRFAEEYVRIACELANDIPRLMELRATLRQRMENSPLMNAPRFARHVEAAYREMWRKWCAAGGVSGRS